jgi:hypothetical protein
MFFGSVKQVKIKSGPNQTRSKETHLELSDYLIMMTDVLDGRITIENSTDGEGDTVQKR